jgi:branched-subunit amino acid aminotransferase/4-amino-4-deoxychorismate lyase
MVEVFTTVRVENGNPIDLVEHLERLHRHARLAGLKIPLNPPFDKGGLGGISDCLMRIAIRDGAYYVTTRLLPEGPKGPVKVILSSQIATSQIKTNNREVYDRAMNEARESDAFEALLCNPEGYVVDATRSSPFLIQGNRVISLLGGIDGITRRKHLAQLSKQGFEIHEAYLKPHELQGKLWIAGSGVGVLEIKGFLE